MQSSLHVASIDLSRWNEKQSKGLPLLMAICSHRPVCISHQEQTVVGRRDDVRFKIEILN
jgi:hypothetical protein